MVSAGGSLGAQSKGTLSVSLDQRTLFPRHWNFLQHLLSLGQFGDLDCLDYIFPTTGNGQKGMYYFVIFVKEKEGV